NTFVKIIINTLWLGKVDVPWVKGRHMFLTYTESPHVLHNTYNRTNNTSFQYTLRGTVDQILIGQVRAIADGALRLKTNKLKDPKKYGVWSKQRCALAFEVSTSPIQLISSAGEKTQYRLADNVEKLGRGTRRRSCRGSSSS